ncbi:protein DEHYDRATION-INDUCED 19 homolog 5-like [Rutidosis leptorrhynchoides]|uniref:protein DEHYDRATION-INDUCED 19 homolog 5-like n=1 Tax=Rutidosis leptorrhynchoides TaxID=125765 RepID=UPI003A9A3296
MEMDFWGLKSHSAKHNHQHFHTLHSGHFNNSDSHLTMATINGDDDVRAWFPCPFCYVEIEIPGLCCHLQEEHCFNLKNAACPICAANLGKDALSHFTSHHVHSIKRRKSQKSGLWSNGVKMTDRGNMLEARPDPLSAFLGNVPFSELEEDKVPSAISDRVSDASVEVKVKDHEEKRYQAAFVQDLIFSTIF